MKIRPIIIIGSITLVLGMAGNLRPGFAVDSERVDFAEACSYYGMRAKSARRSRPDEFVVFLADACIAAEIALDTGTRKQKSRSAQLLSQIVLLRETIDQINSDRANSAAAFSANGLNTNIASGFPSSAGRSRVTMVNPVSPTGEFLIAHRLGLMAAYDAWLDSDVNFSLGSSR